MTLPTRMRGWLDLDVSRYRSREFWIVQALVLFLAVQHFLIEYFHLLPHRDMTYFLPEALMLVPVGYAALTFGFHGAVATALWCTVLTVPNLFFMHGGEEFAASAFQLVIVNAVAPFVGHRMDREISARRKADEAVKALSRSERRYRGLFENSADGILVFDEDGTIHEANAAAAQLVDMTSLQQLELHDALGKTAADALLHEPRHRGPSGPAQSFTLHRPEGPDIRVRIATTTFTGPDGRTLIQAAIQDVTHEHRKQEELRMYAAGILKAQEDERRRIAHELHDESLQRVVLLVRHLHDVEDATSNDTDDAADALERARETAESLMDNLRGFAHQLRPAALDDLGLVACVRRMLGEFEAQTGADVRMAVEGNDHDLSGDVELAMFRIIQEAVRNVERHANASRLNVRVDIGEDAVTAEVVDDGDGFEWQPHPSAEAEGRLGLLGMRERARLLGGRLVVRSASGEGTTVEVRIPRRGRRVAADVA